MKALWQDLRYSLRMLWKHPAFSAVVIVALALGIGVNTATFSVVNAVLLRPLPFKDADRLTVIRDSFRKQGLNRTWLSTREFTDLKEQSQSFDQMGAFAPTNYSLTGGGEPERVQALRITPALFSMLGVAPAAGRNFSDDEGRAGANQVVVVSYGFAQRHWGSALSPGGNTLVLNGKSMNVVGIMPRDFQFPPTNVALGQSSLKPELWTPIAFDADDLSENERGSRNLNVMARLKPGVTVAQAQTEVETIANRLVQEHPTSYPPSMGFTISAFSLQEEVVGNIRTTLLILLGAVVFVLLIACANVANLLLVRATSRSKEMALRTALGAGRGRLVRQLLTESMLLGLIGGGLGLVLCFAGVRLLVALNPGNIPRLNEVGVDLPMLGFTLLLSLLTGIIFGLAPAIQASRLHLNEALKEGGKGSGSGGGNTKLRGLLVVSEVALALVLLLGAGLMIKSLYRLRLTDPGFRSDNLLTMQLNLPQSKYAADPQVVSFYQQVLEQAKSAAGVQSVGAVDVLPLSGGKSDVSFVIEGIDPSDHLPDEEVRVASSDYFQAMGIPLAQGRYFTEQDRAGTVLVTVVNKELVRRYFQHDNPLGKRIAFDGTPEKPNWREIVGVVGNVRHFGLDAEYKPELYLPYPQFPSNSMFLVVRSNTDKSGLSAGLRDKVHAIDRDVPVYDVKTMEELVAASVAQQRLTMLLLIVFSGLALVLAALGIYGVMSYFVNQRTHEIGIRMALGAKPSNILKFVVGQGMSLALVGVGMGLVAAFALTRLMASLLSGISVTDPSIFALVALLLTTVAFLACFIPAHRATRVHPIVALRQD